MKKVLSCIQPTGDLHLGNYFGAVKNWVALQSQYDCKYGVVDYHAMTMPYAAADLRANTWRMVAQLLACGVEAKNLFVQSLIPEHAELSWVLSSVCSFGELSKMTQFKDKKEQLEQADNQAFISVGLFAYPVLQAADILIYHADFVPVGKDQEQHLELSRNIAARFNHVFSPDSAYFLHPAPLFTEIPKLLSLADPSKKMSKSAGEKHYINLFGDIAKTVKQIKSAVTDSGEATATSEMSAGVKNLFELLRACGNTAAYEQLTADFLTGKLMYGTLKNEVAKSITDLVTPFKERYETLRGDAKNVEEQVRASSADIRKTAQQTLREVKNLVGL